MTAERPATHWMIEPLRKYATFSGRARRAEFWWFYLFTSLVGLAVGLIDKIVKIPLLDATVNIGFLVPTLAVSARRLHDVDRSGWWLLVPTVAVVAAISALFFYGRDGSGWLSTVAIAVIAVVGSLVILGLLVLLLVWFVRRGTDGSNRFGEDPLNPAGDFAEVFS